MKQIANRAVITVVPKAPFIAWVQGADQESTRITAELITEHPNAYLIDDTEDGREPEELIKKNFQAIFAEELNGWITDESMWPPKRDLRTFNQWFHATVYSQTFDLGKGPFMIEEWEE